MKNIKLTLEASADLKVKCQAENSLWDSLCRLCTRPRTIMAPLWMGSSTLISRVRCTITPLSHYLLIIILKTFLLKFTQSGEKFLRSNKVMRILIWTKDRRHIMIRKIKGWTLIHSYMFLCINSPIRTLASKVPANSKLDQVELVKI